MKRCPLALRVIPTIVLPDETQLIQANDLKNAHHSHPLRRPANKSCRAWHDFTFTLILSFSILHGMLYAFSGRPAYTCARVNYRGCEVSGPSGVKVCHVRRICLKICPLHFSTPCEDELSIPLTSRQLGGLLSREPSRLEGNFRIRPFHPCIWKLHLLWDCKLKLHKIIRYRIPLKQSFTIKKHEIDVWHIFPWLFHACFIKNMEFGVA